MIVVLREKVLNGFCLFLMKNENEKLNFWNSETLNMYN